VPCVKTVPTDASTARNPKPSRVGVARIGDMRWVRRKGWARSVFRANVTPATLLIREKWCPGGEAEPHRAREAAEQRRKTGSLPVPSSGETAHQEWYIPIS
jgi:hypothetical protein